MKTKKLNLLDFKQNELGKEDVLKIMAGVDKPPRPMTASGNGSGIPGDGDDLVCYYDFEGNLLYCEETIPESVQS
jgi:hypothetical protein